MREQPNIPKTGRFNGISIPTEWNGIAFRSRLEARWAIFFDALKPKLPYEYEPELISTPFGAYLPDFWLPTLHTFWIVKPDKISEEELAKVNWIGEQGYGIFIVEGGIPETFVLYSRDRENYQYSESGGWLIDKSENHPEGRTSYWDMPISFCQCSICGKLGIQFDGLADRVCHHPGNSSEYGRMDIIENALMIARNHRFDRR